MFIIKDDVDDYENQEQGSCNDEIQIQMLDISRKRVERRGRESSITINPKAACVLLLMGTVLCVLKKLLYN